MLLSVRRLPAASSRPAAQPHISPAPPSLGLRRQHGRVAVAMAMARTASTAPVINSHIFSAPLMAKFRLRRQPNVKRYKCNVIRSNLFDRLTRVARSYANAVISSFEDPEKILDQAVLEMNDDLIKMRQATAQDEYFLKCRYRRAQLALQKGDEELAREALKRRKSYAENASSLKTQLDQQKSVVENLVSNTKLLESKIAEARQKKDTLKARAQSAKTATKVSEMLGNVNTSSALSAFEKMEEKVMTMESQAEALGQLGADDLEGKFAMLETTSVDDDLAQMRKELSGSSLKGELPQGRSASPSRDRDIERELNELREKANEY